MVDDEIGRVIELGDYRSDSTSGALLEAGTCVRRRTPWPFLKGPVPVPWLAVATGLPGRALAVGVALWFKAGLTGSHTVKPTGALWQQFGLTRQAVYRGLRQLESAGLVEVDRAPGKNPVVLIKAEAGTNT